ncbi:MAG: hypothetical protein JJT89_17235 [Nitriliruptoraceae bacterium]|nr:hypothetical protein [Nitriliruptoraceae bacterium]
MPTAPDHRPVTEPDHVRAVYLRDPLVHPYGLADVSLYWDRSRWWAHAADPTALVGVL